MASEMKEYDNFMKKTKILQVSVLIDSETVYNRVQWENIYGNISNQKVPVPVNKKFKCYTTLHIYCA